MYAVVRAQPIEASWRSRGRTQGERSATMANPQFFGLRSFDPSSGSRIHMHDTPSILNHSVPIYEAIRPRMGVLRRKIVLLRFIKLSASSFCVRMCTRKAVLLLHRLCTVPHPCSLPSHAVRDPKWKTYRRHYSRCLASRTRPFWASRAKQRRRLRRWLLRSGRREPDTQLSLR